MIVYKIILRKAAAILTSTASVSMGQRCHQTKAHDSIPSSLLTVLFLCSLWFWFFAVIYISCYHTFSFFFLVLHPFFRASVLACNYSAERLCSHSTGQSSSFLIRCKTKFGDPFTREKGQHGALTGNVMHLI